MSLAPPCANAGIAPIRLATPTTDAKRLPRVLEGSAGFLYYVSVAGITGKQQAAQASIEEAVARLKRHTDLPVAVGFGVRTPEQAEAIAKVADGVVVGSALVELVKQHGEDAPAHLRADRRSCASGAQCAITADRHELAHPSSQCAAVWQQARHPRQSVGQMPALSGNGVRQGI